MLPLCRGVGSLAAVLLLWTAPAQGQVLRCTDARTGAVSYTDGSCDTGRKAEQLLPARSAQALALEREEAAQAIARKEQLLRAQAEAAAAAAALNPAPAALPPAAPAESARCGQSRQQLQTLLARPGRAYSQQLAAAQQQVELDCLGSQAYRELEQARSRSAQPLGPVTPVIVVPPLRPPRPLPPQLPPPRPQMQHCNVFRCHDRQGNVYPH